MVRLGDVAEINPRLAIKLSDDDAVSFLGMADVSATGETDTGVLRPYGEVRKGYTAFENGDLLVAKITPCFENGKIAQASIGSRYGFGSTEFHVFRPREDAVSPRYLHHFLRSPGVRRAGELNMTGSAGQKRVPKSFFDQLPIPLPSLPEQRRIAAILDQVVALRATCDQAVATLHNLAEQKFVELCRDYAGSRVVPLESVAAVQGGLTVNRKRGALVQRAPYLRVANIGRGNVDLTEVKMLGVTAAEVARVGLERGDILLVEGHGNSSEVGRAAMWRGESETFVHQNHLIRARFDDEVRPAFAEFYLNSADTRRFFRGVVKTTSGLNTLNMSNVSSVPILVPPLAAQVEFERFLGVLEEHHQRLRKRAKLFATLFTSLQNRAFWGEL